MADAIVLDMPAPPPLDDLDDQVYWLAARYHDTTINESLHRRAQVAWRLTPEQYAAVRQMAEVHVRLVLDPVREGLEDTLLGRLKHIAFSNGPDRVQAVNILFKAIGTYDKRRKKRALEEEREQTIALLARCDPYWREVLDAAFCIAGESLRELIVAHADRLRQKGSES